MNRNTLFKLTASLHKEWLLLWRDKIGMALMFIMPIFLVVVVTLIQDGTFKLVQEKNISLLFINRDTGEYSKVILRTLQKSNMFAMDSSTSITDLEKIVTEKKYKIVMDVPEHYTLNLKNKIRQTLNKINQDVGFTDFGPQQHKENIVIPKSPAIGIAFDPVLQNSYRSAITNAIDQMVRAIESKGLIKALYQDNDLDDIPIEIEKSFSEAHYTQPLFLNANSKTIIPTSTQHNIPAWSLFAMFFIVTSLASNIVKEKLQGSFVRLRTMPSSFHWVLGSKTIVYLMVCGLQLACIVFIGKFIFPIIDLPELFLPFSISGFLFISLCAALAAISFSIAVGLISNTMEQANGFGSIAVIIMAAIGGIWVPTFVMPTGMQHISKLSPMNWALEAYYDLFLRQKSFAEVSSFALFLILFSVLCFLISVWNLKKRNIL